MTTQIKVTGIQNLGSVQFTGIEGGFGEGKKAMLVKDIAEIHGQPVKEINRRINDNISRFHYGLDIIDFLVPSLQCLHVTLTTTQESTCHGCNLVF